MKVKNPFTEEEWEKLPLRAVFLINAGMVDPNDIVDSWRNHWRKEVDGAVKEPISDDIPF